MRNISIFNVYIIALIAVCMFEFRIIEREKEAGLNEQKKPPSYQSIPHNLSNFHAIPLPIFIFSVFLSRRPRSCVLYTSEFRISLLFCFTCMNVTEMRRQNTPVNRNYCCLKMRRIALSHSSHINHSPTN